MGRQEAAEARPPLLDVDEIGLVQESLVLLAGRSDQVVSHFYATLFVEAPQLRGKFPVAMDVQRDRFFRALTAAAGDLGTPERLVPALSALGRDHRKYGVLAEHYDAFGRALLSAPRRQASDFWVPELEAAWVRAYAVMAEIMVEGARAAAEHEPAWWRGEVVAHERRAADLAVVVVRPDRTYDYEPGQYASIETPYRPRSWRTYSMATAPSPDSLLEFHVRAVSAGWVSSPLVSRAQVGDLLRLGPPRGELRIDQHSRRDVLLVAGGTGLAPVKALVQGMGRWNTARHVTLLFGARQAGDLYDLVALRRLADMHRWLTVVPVVSEDEWAAGERGQLPDVLARLGAWADHDVVVCGPPAMTRATVRRLAALGVPAEQVSHDPVAGERPAAPLVIDLRPGRASRPTR